MKAKIKRFFRNIVWGLAVLLFLLVLAAGVKFFLLERAGAEITLAAPPVSTAEKPKLGEIFYLKGEIKVPWNCTIPESNSLLLPENIQSPGEGKLFFQKLAWGYTLWEARLPLQGYEFGKTKKGVSWTLAQKGGKGLTLTLPPLTIEPLQAGDSLAMSLAISPKKAIPLYVYFIGGGALLLLLLFLLFLHLKKKKTTAFRHVPPWEEARNAIAILVDEVRSGKKKREKALTFLSDILSSYIEKRFSIRSTHLTSGEFLRELEKNSSILQESQQHFLRKFLEKAELVKFAALPAENELWEQAAKEAGNFIDETRLFPGNEEKKK